ncbi:MAG: S-methyl-5'-thioadenosine phosphorylase [Deltaproteobacteria bacterium]|nr:S-methyl-5'-thioadenosine phosphorylase [Deltaproteobacteria bacterium]MCL5276659.1 S-methyl-5'-thioadenosine phosphorylase [Deltaproteobacteria bacterium]
MDKKNDKGAIGIIGGSGLYSIEGLKNRKGKKVRTPFGDPSDTYTIGDMGTTTVVFLPRHGKGHRISPSEINFRANIYGMKVLGVERIISVSAVGSMKERIRPGDIVVPDQFIDMTKHRPQTFFEKGIVAHVSMADPVCPVLSERLYEAGKRRGIAMHRGGTYLCIEGPQFSSRAESRLYRQWEVDIIGMTNMPEAKLAREAEMCYATLALATDYDCWYEGMKDVDAGDVVEIMERNVLNAKSIIGDVIREIREKRMCTCAHALRNSFLTSPAAIARETKDSLKPIIGGYIK